MGELGARMDHVTGVVAACLAFGFAITRLVARRRVADPRARWWMRLLMGYVDAAYAVCVFIVAYAAARHIACVVRFVAIFAISFATKFVRTFRESGSEKTVRRIASAAEGGARVARAKASGHLRPAITSARFDSVAWVRLVGDAFVVVATCYAIVSASVRRK